MKHQVFFLQIILFVMLSACNKHNEKQESCVTCTQFPDYNNRYNWTTDSLCNSDTCKIYQSIWKALFLEKNNLSQQYFEDHIILCFSSYHSWDEGISFFICYKIKIDWAIAYSCDQFIIKIKKDNHSYPTLSLPRDTLLSKENIRIALNNGAFSSMMILLSNVDALKFNSNKSALDNLISASNLNTLCFNDIFIDRTTGHMMLKADAQYVNKINACVQGFIDLINGETIFTDIPCAID